MFNRISIGICFIVTFATCLILGIACQKEKDNSGSVIKKEKLTGIVQKGPYVEASVSLYELNPALERTGKIFNGQITDKSGSYEIDNIALSSQYAELKANGYYFNEVSGTVTPYHLSLTAISDIKDLSAVNINLLTHLEKERVRYLVKKGYSFADAKDTAQNEIFSSFGFFIWNMDKSEKLDMTVKSAENAALLALSIILQGNRSVRELTELLDNISADIREDGKLDNDTLLQGLRSTTLKFDLGKIRSNLENRYWQLKVSASIPDFEMYINSFLYRPEPPYTETLDASNITTTGATLNGKVNCNDLGYAVSFEYGTTTSYGSATQEIGVTGHILKDISYQVTGLNPGTLYHFRLKAEYPTGTVYGSDSTFTTLGKIPTAVTQAATNISTEGATLNGTVNANDLNTTVTFEYGTTETYGATVSATPGQVTGHLSTNISCGISGLISGTVYHFRVKTVNPFGTVYGSDFTFTTLGKIPAAITQAATNVSTEGATLNGTVNANDLSTTVTFEYGPTDTYGNSVTATPGLVTGHLSTNVNCGISGLIPGTVYHFRVKTVNSLETVYGNDLTLMTLGKIPTCISQAATNVSLESSTLNGIVNANDLSTTVTFEYGTTESYGSQVSATPGQVTGHTNINVSTVISGLIYNTVYHFRIKSENSLGTVYGSDLTFKTLGGVPSATTNESSAIKGTSATLNGTVNANGLSTDVTFEYGESTSYGNTTSADQSPVTGGVNTYVSANVIGLNPETSYHFRIKAINSLGTSYGNDMPFKTPPGIIYDADGNSYTAVEIGNLVWMAENLKATKYNDNTPIPLVTDNVQWAGMTTPGYCWYNNDETSYKAVYGALYNWYVLDTKGNGGKNVCPLGWHPPSFYDWIDLIDYIGGEQSGEKLMESGTIHWSPPNSDATNETGFTGLPGGARFPNGTFSNAGVQAFFLSSSYTYDYVNDLIICITLSEAGGGQLFLNDDFQKETGQSVRCVLDK